MEKMIFNDTYVITDKGEIYRNQNGKLVTIMVRNPYLQVKLHNKSLKTVSSYYIHILVAKYFLPNPNNYFYLNHKDGNFQNNDVSNLEGVEHNPNRKLIGRLGHKKRWFIYESKIYDEDKLIEHLKIGKIESFTIIFNLLEKSGSQLIQEISLSEKKFLEKLTENVNIYEKLTLYRQLFPQGD